MTATQQQVVAPQGTRRQPPRRGVGTVVLNTVVGLALAAGAVGLQTLALSTEEKSASLTYVGVKDQVVDAGRFAVRFKRALSAKSVKSSLVTAQTDQVFLVIEAEATVPKTPLKLALPVLLAADGKKYDATDKVTKSDTLSEVWIQPGWWAKGRFVFEVPPSALAGAKAIFQLPAGGFYPEPLQPEAQVDLGIDEAAAKQLASAPAEVFDMSQKKNW
ncbi:hypothetical protein [Nonomuraea rhizosphaerae]|uniref:hypothetical protein n=1 Tax=Nonomuraea rhizosphaerae TaxID=2665663 RepID=UPI001C5DF879|nr:hypothetical protein [Nonomuraea rhizosphaerae]